MKLTNGLMDMPPNSKHAAADAAVDRPRSIARFAVHTHQVTESRHYFEAIPPPAGRKSDQDEHCLNPVELILAALGASQEITYRLFAEQLGVELDRVAVTVSGDIDLGGFFDEARAGQSGFQSIDLRVILDSPATVLQLQRLVSAVNAHCPVLQLLCNGTTVNVEVQHGDAVARA